MPEAMRAAVARHDEIIKEEIGAHRGRVFATGGDGMAAAFHRSADAVAAAVAAQRILSVEPWPARIDLRVRMGIHVGETEERGGDYFGTAVNRAARLTAVAAGGQIVVSEVTAGLLGPEADVLLLDLGWHRLRNVTQPMRLFAVEADGLRVVQRTLGTGMEPPGNLPRLPTEFVGDVDNVRLQAGQLADRRATTLIGPGGVGKTRLAIETGWAAVEMYIDGVWLVELASVTEPEQVVAAVAAALSIANQPSMSLQDGVINWLRGRRLLLILDNCEHVLGAAAALVTALMAQLETVAVLATSREPLAATGEHVVQVGSLPLDVAGELFRVRAHAADASFEISDDDRVVVEALCARLDGIPLAIELAAAQVRSMTLTDLNDRLADRFRLLRGTARAGMERHQTLRATVGWSYQMLSESARQLFDRVSVFAGGFDLAAAGAVCADEGVDPADVFELLSSLVDKSMVIADRSGRSVRYRLLETLRQYGEERLADRGDSAQHRDRHLMHYVSIAEAARSLRLSPRQIEGDALFDCEWDNISTALAWAISSGDLAAADRLVESSVSYAWHHLRYEFADWINRLLQASASDGRSSGTFFAAAVFAVMDGRWETGEDYARRGIARNSDPAGAARCWQSLGLIVAHLNRHAEALAAIAEAETFLADTSDIETTWVVLFGRVSVSYADVDSLRAAVNHLSDYARQIGAPWFAAETWQMEGDVCMLAHDYRGALAAYRQGQTNAIQARSMSDEGSNAAGIVAATLAPPASALTSECLDIVQRLYDARNWLSILTAVRAIAAWLTRVGETETATTLRGYLEASAMNLDELVTYLLEQTSNFVLPNHSAASNEATN
jgi:predicted ATPase